MFVAILPRIVRAAGDDAVVVRPGLLRCHGLSKVERLVTPARPECRRGGRGRTREGCTLTDDTVCICVLFLPSPSSRFLSAGQSASVSRSRPQADRSQQPVCRQEPHWVMFGAHMDSQPVARIDVGKTEEVMEGSRRRRDGALTWHVRTMATQPIAPHSRCSTD